MHSLRHHLDLGSFALQDGPHPERARHDAETLLLHVLGQSRSWLLAHSDETLSSNEAEAFSALIERRVAGEPIQYITGETEFYGLPFHVTRDVLIPRPETEHLVEKVIELAAGFPSPRIVDIGAGSGCIAISLAHHLPHAQIAATDIWARALDLARRNAGRNAVSNRIRFLYGDLLAPVAGEQFEIVASNPPYVSILDRNSLAIEVRDHEPALALFAGEDGLEVLRRLIPAAHAVLTPGGFIVLEIAHGQDHAVATLLANAGFHHIEFIPDLQGIPRVACAQRS
jgi:release factor glutamine methyltransferase